MHLTRLIILCFPQESAKTAMEKANDAYERGLRSLTIRTMPLGYDRYYNAVFHFPSDPSLVLLRSDPEEKALLTSGAYQPTNKPDQELQWYVIDCKSLYDGYVSSLDNRGIREGALLEAIANPNITIRRHLHDDIKEQHERKLAKKKLQELETKLETAKASSEACGENGDGERKRSSGRLATLAKHDLVDVEREVKREHRVWAQKMFPPLVPDTLQLTGSDTMCALDIERIRASLSRLPNVRSSGYKANAFPKHYTGLRGSEHLSTSLCRPGGVVEVLVTEMQELASWITASYLSPQMVRVGTKKGQTINEEERKAELDQAVEQWKAICEPGVYDALLPLTKITVKDRKASKKQTMEVLDVLRRELLDLEATLHQMSGVQFVFECQALIENDEESDSDSDSEDEDENEKDTKMFSPTTKRKNIWKRIVSRLHHTATFRYAKVRETIILAIAAAKKSNQIKIVNELRSALKLYRDGAASACKAAALKVLEEYGGYSGPKHLDMDDQEDLLATDAQPQDGDNENDGEEEGWSGTMLTDEAGAINACIDGTDYADRQDWVDAVKAKDFSVARFAALAQAFFHQAMEVLAQLEEGHDNLQESMKVWGKQAKDEEAEEMASTRRTTRRGSSSENMAKKPAPLKKKKVEKKEEEVEDAGFIWTHCDRVMDQMAWVKVSDEWPWCPAFVCEPTNSKMAKTLDKELDRALVCHVGYETLYAVRVRDNQKHFVEPYSPTNCPTKDDDEEFDESIVDKVQKSKSMAKHLYQHQLEINSKSNGKGKGENLKV
jgi:hypothetical protein